MSQDPLVESRDTVPWHLYAIKKSSNPVWFKYNKRNVKTLFPAAEQRTFAPSCGWGAKHTKDSLSISNIVWDYHEQGLAHKKNHYFIAKGIESGSVIQLYLKILFGLNNDCQIKIVTNLCMT